MLILLLSAVLARSPDLLHAEPLSLPAGELLALSAESSAAGEVLLDEETLTLASESTRHSVRRVFRVGEGTMSLFTLPWGATTSEPLVRVRVIGPHGGSTELHPRLIREEDTLRVEAAPAGALVELWAVSSAETVVVGEKHALSLAVSTPTRHLVRQLVFPRKLAPQWAVGGGHAAKVRTKRGSTTVRVHLEQARPLGTVPDRLPAERTGPMLQVSTLRSWEEVGRRWAERHGGVLQTDGLERVVDPVRGRPTAERIQQAFAWSALVETVAGDLVVPRPPAEVLEAGQGTQLDKVNLLLALLGALQVEAVPALLSTAGELDPRFPDADLDEVLVYLPAQRRWLDPSGPRGLGDGLAFALQGRLALLVDGERSRLLETPWGEAAQHVRERELQLDLQAGTVQVSRSWRGGWTEEDARFDHTGIRKATAYAQWVPELPVVLEQVGQFDDGELLRTTVSGRLQVDGGEIVIPLDDVFEQAVEPIRTGATEGLAERPGPFWFPAHTAQRTVRVVLPEGARVSGLPESVVVEAGSLHFERTVTEEEGGFTVTDRFVAGQPLLPAAVVGTFLDALQAVERRPQLRITL